MYFSCHSVVCLFYIISPPTLHRCHYIISHVILSFVNFLLLPLPLSPFVISPVIIANTNVDDTVCFAPSLVLDVVILFSLQVY